jgi:hypothetical protein
MPVRLERVLGPGQRGGRGRRRIHTMAVPESIPRSLTVALASRQATQPARTRGDRVASPRRRARRWSVNHSGACAWSIAADLVSSRPVRTAYRVARHAGQSQVDHDRVQPHPRPPRRPGPVTADLRPRRPADVVVAHRWQHGGRRTSERRPAVAHELGPGDSGQRPSDHGAVRPRGMPSLHVVHGDLVEVGAAEVGPAAMPRSRSSCRLFRTASRALSTGPSTTATRSRSLTPGT